MKHLLFALLLSLTLQSFAQTAQTDRLEIEYDSDNETGHEFVPMGKEGAIMMVVIDGNNRDTKTLSLTKYDTRLKQMWQKQVTIKRAHFSYHTVTGNDLYVFIHNTKTAEYRVIKLNIVTGDLKEMNGVFAKGYTVYKFVAKGDHLYFDGSYKKKQYIAYLNMSGGTFALLPVVPKGSKAKMSIESMDFEENSEVITIVTLGWEGKHSQLSFAQYNAGNKTNSYFIESNPEKNIITARVNELANGERLIIGTYSEGGKYSNGMYVCKFKDNDQKFIKFYNFNDFENFLKYLPQNQQEKLEKKIEKKEAKGQEMNFNYNLLVHDVIERNDEYLLIAEAYYATYRTETYMTYTTGPNGTMIPVYRTRQVFDGWLYTHALIAGFDLNGGLVWDNTFEMGDFKSFSLYQRITVDSQDKSKIILAYSFGTKIRMKVIKGDKVYDDKDVEVISTGDEDEKLRYSTADMRYWYDQYFIAYGYQKIKNEKSGKRWVFYCNKVGYGK